MYVMLPLFVVVSRIHRINKVLLSSPYMLPYGKTMANSHELLYQHGGFSLEYI